MQDNAMRESLLQQGTATSATVRMLNEVAEVEERRARRLMLLTRGVGVAWLIALVLSAINANEKLVLVILLPLTVVGAVLLVAQWLASRAVTISQLRVSVASIEEQLRALSAQPAAPAADAQPGGESWRVGRAKDSAGDPN